MKPETTEAYFILIRPQIIADLIGQRLPAKTAGQLDSIGELSQIQNYEL